MYDLLEYKLGDRAVYLLQHQHNVGLLMGLKVEVLFLVFGDKDVGLGSYSGFGLMSYSNFCIGSYSDLTNRSRTYSSKQFFWKFCIKD